MPSQDQSRQRMVLDPLDRVSPLHYVSPGRPLRYDEGIVIVPSDPRHLLANPWFD